jgi:protein-S-isoprenylcysteine O-methyltransferase Ste14
MREKHQSETAGGRVPFPPPLAYIVGIAIGFTLHLFVPVRIVTSEGAAHALFLAGAGVLAVSASLVLSAVVSFRKAQTTPYFGQATTSLIVRGPFRVSRNPLYVAGALFHVGLSLVTNNLWVFVLLIPALAVVNALIRREEEYLTARFGSEYEAYCKRVPRWL